MRNMASPVRKRSGMPIISNNARRLAQWGRIAYWTGTIFSILIFGMAMLFAILDIEPIFQRVTSVLILGAIPALLVRGGAFAAYHLLKEASSHYDRTATALRWFSRRLAFPL